MATLPLTLGLGGLSALTSIFGGLFGSHAAEKAAQQQANAAQGAGDSARQTANEEAGNIAGAVPGAMRYVGEGATNANNLLSLFYQQGLMPYQQAGQDALGNLSTLSQGPGFQWDESQDPGFQFRLDQGAKLLQNKMGASGGAMGGAAAKAMERYGQDYASNEYQNSFNRFQTDRTNRASILGQLVGAGTTANQQGLSAMGLMSGNTMDAGKTSAQLLMNGTQAAADMRMHGADTYANALTQKGNANAAGTVGSANAWTNALGGVSGGMNNAALLYALLSKKGMH